MKTRRATLVSMFAAALALIAPLVAAPDEGIWLFNQFRHPQFEKNTASK